MNDVKHKSLAKMNKITNQLITVLDANFIYYDVLNDGQHVRVYDDNKDIWWNFYPSKQTFHKDKNPIEGKGIKVFLDKLDLAIADPNAVGIGKENDGFEVHVMSPYTFTLSRGPMATQDITGISLPIDVPFSIVQIGEEKAIYWIVITDNRMQIYLNTGSIYVSVSKKINYGTTTDGVKEEII